MNKASTSGGVSEPECEVIEGALFFYAWTE